jgi:hypothetical protein
LPSSSDLPRSSPLSSLVPQEQIEIGPKKLVAPKRTRRQSVAEEWRVSVGSGSMMSIARLGSLGNLIETWDATIKRDRLLAKLANLGIARGAARGQALNRWTREWPLIAAPWPITSGPMGSILRDHPIWSEPNELMGAEALPAPLRSANASLSIASRASRYMVHPPRDSAPRILVEADKKAHSSQALPTLPSGSRVSGDSGDSPQQCQAHPSATQMRLRTRPEDRCLAPPRK